MLTRVEVARKAGVSEATVSHVINGTKFVSDELRMKVEKAVAELGYKPNFIARSLATKVSKHVGILVNDITNPYYGKIAQGMEEVARINGYMVSIFAASASADELYANIMQRQMDGLFIATVQNRFSEEQVGQLHNKGVAIVNGSFNTGSVVDFNYDRGMNLLIRHLKEFGHKQIAYLSGLSMNDPAHWRYNAFLKALKRQELLYDPGLAVDGQEPYETTCDNGYIAMKKLLKMETRVTAVVATNDLMAYGAMKAIREAGLKIPGDISVAGCDDIFLSSFTDPPLTTLTAPIKELGKQAMYLILQEIQKNGPKTVYLDLDLSIRGSTGIAKESKVNE